jgi:glucuronoarabinoxylan endo-1,4-beta-xylanase
MSYGGIDALPIEFNNAVFDPYRAIFMLKFFSVFQGLTLFVVLGANSIGAASVTFEAESGEPGSDFTNGTDSAVQYISISTDTVNSGNPGNTNRLATYKVNFPMAGTYQLYARLRVGSGGYNDDSMFYAGSFGSKSPTNSPDWVFVNGLAGVGFSNGTEVVTGGGTLGSGMWKWINLSLLTSQSGFAVSAGSLTQTFQIGARENGLDMDKLVFGTASYTFTVSNLDNGTGGTPPPPPVVTIDASKTYQTIEGLGGAIAFYNGWITAHPYRLEIYTNAFAGLNLSMLRLGNWFRYTNSPDTAAFEIVSNANRILGRQVPVLMSSWAPPAFLKSNGQVGNGGTLLDTNGVFVYNAFAQYWHDSLLAYGSNGISPTWISIQNEPDWEAGYDSCIFRPVEGMYNGTNWAGYSNALSATYLRLTNLPSPPKLLGPENVGLYGNSAAVSNYAAMMNSNHFYGVAHHLYGGSTNGSPDGYNSALSVLTNIFPGKPRFMTEYGVTNMIEQANLIHNVLTVEQASGYNYWSLIWPGMSGGLIQIENPWNQSSWTNAPPGTPTQSHGWWIVPAYWAMKHYSCFIQPGYKRVAATCSNATVLVSACLSPDGLRLVAVFINRDTSSSTADVNFGSFPYYHSSVYQTADTNCFQSLGSCGAQLNLPALSLTTVVLDKFVAVGSAANPSPANGESGVALNTALSWTPGSNALVHALYLGTGSNSVVQATAASPEFRGILTGNSFHPALFGDTAYYWRVDEIAGANTNTGAVWSCNTRPAPALAHRYSFGETNGTTVADSVSGPAWDGTLPGGGTFSGGRLTLASSAQQYVSLPAGIVSPFSNFTIEAWVKLNSTTNWSRIFDFGNNTTSYLFLTPQNGSTTRLRFGITTNGAAGEQQINGTSALTADVWHHVAVTLNANTGILYLNGVAVGTNRAMTLQPPNLGNTVTNYLGKSQWSDPHLNGSLDEFRIYSVALSADELAATEALGPDQALSTNSPAISFTNTESNLTLTWPLACAGFAVQSSTNLVPGSWTMITSPVPQIVGGQWQIALPRATNADATFYRLSKRAE